MPFSARRLRRKADFDAVFRSGRRRARVHPFMILCRRAESSSSVGWSRVGVAIGRKHARRAVDRNRVKRLIRETFREVCADLPAGDYVVLPMKGVAELSNERLFRSLRSAWREAQ